ncbi:hypothetical protein G647_08954 [Cladophialophora carrionii CBS 160.54]|uniref:Xylanolytic transcriptional activator regulatory domain-containing protein n=1 Tax=Cladophialophora carrionii CBS 160.54 TaxID=1279043 RepID=V9CZ70_9EURO|nr:uncharacterized protein G647_08954 [Cladophialophora carrionii CBS 160.54]ETI19939.1 hypothetical protein G647_08954 [Cladophialophora carrionii CBS 160.54]
MQSRDISCPAPIIRKCNAQVLRLGYFSGSSRSLKARQAETRKTNPRQSSAIPELSPTRPTDQQTDSSPQNDASRLPRVDSAHAPSASRNLAHEGSEMLLVRLTDIRDNDQVEPRTKVTNKVVYFGDESIWFYSLREARNSKSRCSVSPQSFSAQSVDRNIHYKVPQTLDDQPRDVPEDDAGLKQEEIHLLQHKGAFSLPPLGIQRGLLDAYFSWLHPLQPIIDKQQFLCVFNSGQAPIILLQALLFAGTTCCDESVILKYWPSRRSAQAALYKRTKALYDADQEQNRVTIVQVLFLMCFWWGSPTDNKDFSHWLAASIHLAQVMGMHRSTKHSQLSIKDRKLWKRIWWTLYVRDHFDAASVGRPMMIDDDDCDVEPLRETDFEHGEDEKPPLGAGHCIEMTKLAALSMRSTLLPKANWADLNNLADSWKTIDNDLSGWEKQLPEQFRYHEGERSPQLKLFASMLTLGLHFCRIILHRKIFLDSKPKADSISMAPASANAVTRVVEELVTEGLLPRTQVHLIAVIFASFTIHVISMEQSLGARRRVLQHRAELCLLGLGEFRDYWPFVDWMYRLFSNLLPRLGLEDGSSEASDNRELWNNQPRPENMILQDDLMDSTPEVPHDNQPTISLPMFDQNANSTADVQPEFGARQQFMSGMFTSENFLDPFMPLDNLEWYDSNTASLAYLGGSGNTMQWTGDPPSAAEKTSLS